jgi:hypothetical protein
MAAPTLVSNVPTDAATEVAIEQQVVLTFSTALDPDSINEGTISVFRSDDLVPLRGDYNLTSGDTVVTFTPEKAFFQDTLYKIVLLGSDQGLGYGIKAATGEFFASTTVLSFRTGTERFVSLPEIASRDDIERIGPIRETDPLAIQPVGGSLEVDAYVPEQFASNVSVSATGLHIDFSLPIDASTVDTDSVVIEQAPVLGIEDYYATIPSGSTDPEMAVLSGPFTPPTGELRVEGDKVVFQIDPAGEFLHNTEVHVTLTTDVQSTTGASLESEVDYFFTTEYFPLFVGARYIRTELGSAIGDITDDTINRIIHKNSIEAWELSSRGINLSSPTWWARKWVICKTILDMLGVLKLSADLSAGQAKTLGDLSISVRPASPHLGAKHQQAVDCIKDLGDLFGADLMATVAVKGIGSSTERGDFRMRTWDHLLLQRRAAANTAPERGEKGRLSQDYALGGKDPHAQLFFLSVDLTHFP